MSKQVEPIAKCPGCGVPMDALDLHVSDGYICLLRQRDAERAAREKAEAVVVAATSLLSYLKGKHPEIERDGWNCPYMRALDEAVKSAGKEEP